MTSHSSSIVRRALALCLAVCARSVLACAPFVEERPSESSASLRPHTTAFEQCTIDEATYRRVVSEWIRTRDAASASVSSLSLGRAVTYPWLSQHIADSALASPQWASRMSKARPGEREKLAAPVLVDPALLQRLAAPFEGTQYVVVRLTFEKVLFGRADAHSSNGNAGPVMVPFDAQLWLRLAPRS